jgi:hypothetical protein
MGVPEPRKPTVGIAGCCARAASGHAADAPPSGVMKSRRFIAYQCMPSSALNSDHQNRKARQTKLVSGAEMCAAQIPRGL